MAQTTDKARRWTVRAEYRLTKEERQRIRRSLDWSHASEEERAAMQEEQRQGLAVEPLSTKEAAELYRRKLGQYEQSGRGAYRPALFEQHTQTWTTDRPSKAHAVLAVLGWLEQMNEREGMQDEEAARYFFGHMDGSRAAALLCAEVFQCVTQ